MLDDYEDLFAPRPFWFARSQLLAEVFRAEIQAIAQLFSKYPDLRKLFDAPHTTIPQRVIVFELLTHRKVIEIVDETLVGRYENPFAFNEEEKSALENSHNLVRSDAPAWVLEMNEFAEWLPARINRALPELLRERGFNRDDPAQIEAIRSAAKTLDTVEQIRSLTARVFDEQLKRLKERWSASIGQAEGPKMPKHWQKGTKGLGPKTIDLSRYMNDMTEKQQLAFSLKYEYMCGPVEIASRMGIDRSTMYEHLEAANKKLEQARSLEKRNHTKHEPAE